MSGYSVYAAAKAGLYNFTKSLARELAPDVLLIQSRLVQSYGM